MAASTWRCCSALRCPGELLTRGDVCHVRACRRPPRQDLPAEGGAADQVLTQVVFPPRCGPPALAAVLTPAPWVRDADRGGCRAVRPRPRPRTSAARPGRGRSAMADAPSAPRESQVRPRRRLSRVEERRVAGRGSVAYPALSQPGRRPSPVGTFPPPALRTRRADFRHRALQWNHAARARASRSRPAHGSREPWHQARTLAPAGRCVVRPVDALATATARVVPFACACDDIRHSCSSPG